MPASKSGNSRKKQRKATQTANHLRLVKLIPTLPDVPFVLLEISSMAIETNDRAIAPNDVNWAHEGQGSADISNDVTSNKMASVPIMR